MFFFHAAGAKGILPATLSAFSGSWFYKQGP